MAEALAAAYGFGAIYEGAQTFYAGYQAVNTAYGAYKYFYPDQNSTDDTFTAAGEFSPSGNESRKPIRRRRYRYRRY